MTLVRDYTCLNPACGQGWVQKTGTDLRETRADGSVTEVRCPHCGSRSLMCGPARERTKDDKRVVG